MTSSHSSPRPLDLPAQSSVCGQKLALLAVVLLPVFVLFKRVPAEIAVGVTVLTALFIAIRHRDFSWLAQAWVYAAAALSILLLLLSPFSINPGNSALSAILAFRWPVFAAALIWFWSRQPQLLVWFERVMVGLIAFIVLDTFWQYATGWDVFGYPPASDIRLTGPFDKMLVGTFTDRIWFIGLAVVWFALRRRNALMALMVIAAFSAVGALFLFLTGERAALLTYLLGSGLVVLGIIIHYRQWRMPLIGLIAVFGVAAAGAAMTQQDMVKRSFDSTVQTIRHLDETVYGLNFMTAFAEFKEHPWTGVGAREFKAYCDTHMPAYSARYDAMGFQGAVIHPHNFYTGMLAEGGVFSFLALVAMVVLLFARLIRDSLQQGNPMQAYFGSAVLLTTFWPLQSTMEYFNGWTAAVIWLGVAWALARARLPC
ncbi:O-antigen ligase family protein [Halothiobacillus sp. DCM-1]|uniref:O-antigen ligase family protein n=1 Tax=Halothiobacillus sp. DCM-1 TaxID=3112558 RepID=UPI00324B3769